jgi:hypothetical protein
MVNYNKIKGQNIDIVTYDPTSTVDGQIWYNTTTCKLTATIISTEGWINKNSLNSNRSFSSGAGTTTATLAFGGAVYIPYSYIPYGWTAVNCTELYNGTSWTNTSSMNTGRYGLAGVGTSTAALGFGGYAGYIACTPTTPYSVRWYSCTESWNGSSWTTVNSLNTARHSLGGVGTQTAALGIAGYAYALPSTGRASSCTESWNGTVWTASTTFPKRSYGLSATGTSTSALVAGGQRWDTIPTDACNILSACYVDTEVLNFNGSVWTTNPNNININSGGVLSGTTTSSLLYGGNGGFNTEKYNGTVWSIGKSMNNARTVNGLTNIGGGVGNSNTNALAFGGYGGNYNCNCKYVTLGLTYSEEYTSNARQNVFLSNISI